MNIYLTVYCRRLNPKARILTRVTHERNVEAIQRAGADFVLSYASLGVQTVYSIVAPVNSRNRVSRMVRPWNGVLCTGNSASSR